MFNEIFSRISCHGMSALRCRCSVNTQCKLLTQLCLQLSCNTAVAGSLKPRNTAELPHIRLEVKSGLQKHKILAMASNLLAKVFVSVSKKALLKVPQHLIVFFSFVVSLSLSLSLSLWLSLFLLWSRGARCRGAPQCGRTCTLFGSST